MTPAPPPYPHPPPPRLLPVSLTRREAYGSQHPLFLLGALGCPRYQKHSVVVHRTVCQPSWRALSW